MAINIDGSGRTFTRAHGTCARCGRHGELRSRRLDANCYQISRTDGTLDDYPRARQRLADRIEDYEFLASTGASREAIAQRMGATVEAVRVLAWRARKRRENEAA